MAHTAGRLCAPTYFFLIKIATFSKLTVTHDLTTAYLQLKHSSFSASTWNLLFHEWDDYNCDLKRKRIEQFLDILVARMFTFGSFRLLEFTAPEKQDVNLAQLFR